MLKSSRTKKKENLITGDAANVKVAALVLAGGSGTRFGGDKTIEVLGGKPLWKWSTDAFLTHPTIARVFVVGRAHFQGEAEASGATFVVGGDTRQQSCLNGLKAIPGGFTHVLVHDSARPFVTQTLISRVIEAAITTGAAAAVTAVTDTIRTRSAPTKCIDRTELLAMQTPQGFAIPLLLEGHRQSTDQATDEISLIESLGHDWTPVMNDNSNFKVTTAEDLVRARQSLTSETRTGLGYDIHPFSEDSSRPLWLGGVHFPNAKALAGHSDADVILHAVVDALLGAASMGDIGQHFPPGDPQWLNAPSLGFVKHAGNLVEQEGWRIVNLDIAVVAETPKIMPRANEIRSAIASTLGIEISRVNVKATTNERLGSIGREEGICAFATATLQTK